jgi:hypothetical protein
VFWSKRKPPSYGRLLKRVAFVGPESGGSVQSSLLRMHHPLLIAAIVVGVIFVALAVHVLRFLAKPEDFR